SSRCRVRSLTVVPANAGTTKGFSFINIKFFKSPGDSYPPLPNRSYDRRVLSSEGALLEASLKWDRARAWPGRGNPSRPDAAPEVVPRKHRLGRPWVSVRAHYRALPLCVAGRGQAAARNRRQATSPEERTRVLRRRGGAPGGVAVCSVSRRSGEQEAACYNCAFRRSASPLPKGRQT